MSSPRSICVLRLSAIGDTCNAVSVIQAIQAHFPDAAITWVIGKTEAALLADLPGVELIVFDKKQGLSAYTQLRRQLSGRVFDVLLHMQLALRANLVSLCISARRRIGYDRDRSKELHSLFINERICPAKQPHVLDTFRQFAAALGVPLSPPTWQIPVSPDDAQWARQHLSAEQPRHLIITAAASASERNWLPERYAQLADYASSQGFAVYLCGGPVESEIRLAEHIQQLAQSKIHNLVGHSTLKQLYALLQLVDVVVAPDTGPAHMAVAAGTPVIGLYAHSNPNRTGPYSWRQYVADAYTPLLQLQGRTASQVPWGFRLKGDDLMQHISTDQVCRLLDQVIHEQSL